MSAVYGYGIQGILPHDFTKDQVIGNLRILLRLGFSPRIVEVINGKVIEFTFEKGEVKIDEIGGAEGDRILELWDDGLLGSMSHTEWRKISPEFASVFLPSAEDYFEQLDNIEGKPVYIDSIGNVCRRLESKLAGMMREDSEDEYDNLENYLSAFSRALANDFVITISA